jgi:hypothetical protein
VLDFTLDFAPSISAQVINDLSSIHCDALNLAQFISSYYLYETRKRFKINTYHN